MRSETLQATVTREMIERRAFELLLTTPSMTPEENWRQAEQELREEAWELTRLP